MKWTQKRVTNCMVCENDNLLLSWSPFSSLGLLWILQNSILHCFFTLSVDFLRSWLECVQIFHCILKIQLLVESVVLLYFILYVVWNDICHWPCDSYFCKYFFFFLVICTVHVLFPVLLQNFHFVWALSEPSHTILLLSSFETVFLSENVLANGLASHMLACVCSLGSQLNVHAKPKKSGHQEIQLTFKSIT